MEALSRKTEKEKLVELEEMLADATTLTGQGDRGKVTDVEDIDSLASMSVGDSPSGVLGLGTFYVLPSICLVCSSSLSLSIWIRNLNILCLSNRVVSVSCITTFPRSRPNVRRRRQLGVVLLRSPHADEVSS